MFTHTESEKKGIASSKLKRIEVIYSVFSDHGRTEKKNLMKDNWKILKYLENCPNTSKLYLVKEESMREIQKYLELNVKESTVFQNPCDIIKSVYPEKFIIF
jgi:hypothetical protein